MNIRRMKQMGSVPFALMDTVHRIEDVIALADYSLVSNGDP